MVAALHFKDLLQHIRRSAAGHIFIHTDDAIGFFQGLNDGVMNIKGEEGLYVNDFDFNADFTKQFRGIQRNRTQRAISDERNIVSFA
mgnify:CR=1 FL=1